MARRTRSGDWAELADDVGEEPDDLAAVVAAAGWEAPLRIEAEHLVLAALGAVPLIEVEAEGLPLSLVRAAEAATRGARPRAGDGGRGSGGARCSSPRRRWSATGAPQPIGPDAAERLAAELSEHGLEPDDVVAVLPYLPVQPETADSVRAILRAAGIGRRRTRAQSWAATSGSRVSSGLFCCSTRRPHLSVKTREQGAVGALQHLRAARGGDPGRRRLVGTQREAVGQPIELDRGAELVLHPVHGHLELHGADGGEHRCAVPAAVGAQHLDDALGVQLRDALAELLVLRGVLAVADGEVLGREGGQRRDR